MKFYIASGLENAEMVTAFARVLKAYKWTHTYDWTVHGNVQEDGKTRLTEVATKEIKGVVDADVVIVLLPGGRGTHAELGAANALNRPVFIWAESEESFLLGGRTCAFYWNRNVTRVIGDRFKLLEALFEYASKVEQVVRYV
jgi:nucleoside 2-deoxyribosyltransferase